MAGIYIHIPFCAQRCSYCDFHFSTNLSSVENMHRALAKELRMHAPSFRHPIATIYFGGGTPSIFSGKQIGDLLRTISNNYVLEPSLEITLEANPEDLTPDKLRAFRKAGINRLSIGVQSFFDADLAFMNRNHSAAQAFSVLAAAQKEGFDNINMDLIYGSPTTSNEHWEKNIDYFLERQIPHLSAYALTVEPKTALEHRVKFNQNLAPTEERAAEQFRILQTKMQSAGYLHYEISNFALPEKLAIHNTNYWKSSPYLGIGPSAHSFLGNQRTWNVRNNKKYIDAIENEVFPREVEELTLENRFNERIMTSLRTIWGINLRELQIDFPSEWIQQLEQEAEIFLTQGKMKQEAHTYVLTEDARFLADGIAGQLFKV